MGRCLKNAAENQRLAMEFRKEMEGLMAEQELYSQCPDDIDYYSQCPDDIDYYYYSQCPDDIDYSQCPDDIDYPQCPDDIESISVKLGLNCMAASRYYSQRIFELCSISTNHVAQTVPGPAFAAFTRPRRDLAGPGAYRTR